jgi:FkbM family methyltransferase
MKTIARGLKKCVPLPAKVWLREKIFNFYGVPWNRHGVPPAMASHFRGSAPITLVDVGASRGEFTQSLSNFCGVRKALLVEIQPARCDELRQRFPNPSFHVVCAAAGSREEVVDIDVLAWDYSTSLLTIDRTDSSVAGANDFSVRERIKTRVRLLDDICTESGFTEEIDLLKLDVQGAEGMVLAGATQTLHRARAVWTEVSFRPIYKDSVTFEGIYQLFRNAGFRLVAIEEAFCGVDGELLQADALFVRGNTANGHAKSGPARVS